MPSTPAKAKKPQDHQKPAQTFGKKAIFPLDLPSGNSIVVKRPGVNGLVKAGVLESLDALTGIVQTETIPKAEGTPTVDIAALAKDPEKLQEMLSMMDKIVLHVVVEPPLTSQFKLDENDNLTSEEIPDEERDDDAFYVDYVADEDKTFIMNFALGGSADLAAFRQATEEAVGSVHAGEAATNPAK